MEFCCQFLVDRNVVVQDLTKELVRKKIPHKFNQKLPPGPYGEPSGGRGNLVITDGCPTVPGEKSCGGVAIDKLFLLSENEQKKN